MAEGVVDVLEIVEVEEERGDLGVLTSRTRQHAVDAVENQRTVGQTGERIMQRLVLQLIGSLFDELHCARSTRAEYVDQQGQQEAQKDSAEKDQCRTTLAEDAAGDGGGEGHNVPPVMKADRRRHRVLRTNAGL